MVSDIVRNTALQGNLGASLDELLKFAEDSAQQSLDQFFQHAIWRWLRTSDLRITDNGRSLTPEELEEPFEKIQKERSLRFFAPENTQWVTLTGRPKYDNNLGQYPFELLCAVSRARARGITTVELSKVTGQDPRSIFSRINTLMENHLVTKQPVVESGTHTHRMVFHQYISENAAQQSQKVTSEGFNKSQVAKKLVELVKSAPNGLRLCRDLTNELGFEDFKRGYPMFRRLVKKLSVKGIVRRVDVYEPEDPGMRYRCVQYLQDYREDDVRDEEELSDDEEDDTTDEPAGQAPDFSKVVVAEQALANLYYPLSTQLWDLVASSGSQGVSAMQIHCQLTGTSYAKVFSRLIDAVVQGSAKQPAYRGHLSLVRVTDFQARVKFFRYFLPSPPKPQWGEFSPQKSCNGRTSLLEIERKAHTPLPTPPNVGQLPDGYEIPIFHGDKPGKDVKIILSGSTSAAATTKKRGRPRKDAPKQPVRPPSPEIPMTSDSCVPIGSRVWEGGHPANSQHTASYLLSRSETGLSTPASSRGAQAETAPEPMSSKNQAKSKKKGASTSKSEVPKPSSPKPSMSPSTADPNAPPLSLALQKRTDIIIDLVRASGGAAEGKFSMLKRLNDVYAPQNGGSLIDRKTFERTVHIMVALGKICQQFIGSRLEVTGSPPYVLHLPEISADDPVVKEATQRILDNDHSKRANRPSEAAPVMSGQIFTLSGQAPLKRIRRLREPQPVPSVVTSVANASPRPTSQPERRVFGPRASEVASWSVSTAATNLSTQAARKRPQPVEAAPEKRQKEDVEVDTELLWRYAIISKVLNGKSQLIDWGTVVRNLGVPATKLKKLWPKIRDFKGGKTAQLKAEHEFERAFLLGYSLGHLVYNAQQASLEPYLDWWVSHADDASTEKLGSRSEFESVYGKIKSNTNNYPLDSVYTMPSMVRMEELLAATPFGVEHKVEMEETDFSDDEKVLRSVIAADEDGYDPVDATRFIHEAGFDDERLKQTLDGLIAKRFTVPIAKDMQRSNPGRTHALHDRIHQFLSCKLEPVDLVNATHFRASLLNEPQFLGRNIVEHQMVALIELASRGFIDIKRDAQATGRLLQHDYRSRLISKDIFDCDVYTEPSANIPDEPSPVPSPIPCGHRYIWEGPNGVCSSALWRQLLAKMGFTLLLRPQITHERLATLFSSVLTVDEVDAVVNYFAVSNAIQPGGRLTPNWYSQIIISI